MRLLIFIVDLFIERQLNVQQIQVERERRNEEKPEEIMSRKKFVIYDWNTSAQTTEPDCT